MTCIDMANPTLQEKNEVFIADTGASTHMIINDEGMFDVEEINTMIKVGNREKLICKKKGKVKVKVKQDKGKDVICVFEDVMYVPDLWVNLFSIGKALKHGWKLANDKETMLIKKTDKVIRFDQEIKTDNGRLSGLLTERINCTERGKRTFMDIHRQLGHAGPETCKHTIKKYGWKVNGDYENCESCMKGKARQKPMNKDTSTHASEKGERIFIDIAPMKHKSFGGSKNWSLIVDDNTDCCWSYFLKSKDQLKDYMRTFIKVMKEKESVKIQTIRMDNAGENLDFKQMAENEFPWIKYKLTSPGTPQQNSRVERKFATLFGFARSMLDDGGFLKTMQ